MVSDLFVFFRSGIFRGILAQFLNHVYIDDI